jgi:hypothetical protein
MVGEAEKHGSAACTMVAVADLEDLSFADRVDRAAAECACENSEY